MACVRARGGLIGLLAVALLALGGAAWSGCVDRVPDAQVASGPEASVAADGSERHGHYQCAMHPQIVSDRPGICPICQMKLQHVDDGGSAASAPIVAGRTSDGQAAKRSAFTLSPERRQLIGVKTATVERRPLTAIIRAAARVAYDPKLYQAIAEYREAERAQRELAGSSSSEARTGAAGLVRAAALKLRQQGLSEAQARALAAGSGAESLLLPGKSVWVYAQVHDADAALVAPGQALVVTSPGLPGRSFAAKVASIDPIVDPMTRTTRVRALVETPNGDLRPESFVQVRIVVPLGEALAVPREAIVDTGDEQVAFVSLDGRFEPRRVVLGREAEGQREVLSGLAPGEEVVVSANFLIDSEARFRAAAAQFERAPAAGRGDASAGPPASAAGGGTHVH